MNLIAKAIPPVSRDFARELKRRFKPFEPKPGFDRDELMQSVGEQRVINWILHQSSNTVIQSTVDIKQDIVDELPEVIAGKVVPYEPEESKTWFSKFTNRFGN